MPEHGVTEFLCVRGVHGRDLQLELVRSYSTSTVRRWPRDDGAYRLELLAEDGSVLLSEVAEASERWGCEPGHPVTWRVTGYVALREDGRRVRLRLHDVVLLEQDVPPEPSVTLSWRRKQVERGETIVLEPRVSDPIDPSAWVQVVHQWGPRRHRTLGFFAPNEPIRIDTAELPGGEQCRLVVGYSNGLRSATTATGYFRLDPQPATIEIVEPRASDVIRPWQPIELHARVTDPQRPPPHDEELVWEIDAGHGPSVVAAGTVTSIDPLPVGAYTLQVRCPPRDLVAMKKLHVRGQRGVDTWADTWADPAP